MPESRAETLLGATGWADGQPDMEGNDTRFNAESHEEQNKRSGLLAAVELGGDGTEAGEFGAAAGLDQQSETKQQATGVNVRHDDVKQPRSPALVVFMVKRHKPVGGKRHEFPCNQEQKGIRSGKDNRQAEK